MGTLRKTKLWMKLHRETLHAIVRSSRNEILIDMDGDKEADLALYDLSGDGNIDTIAADLSGNGEFDLLIMDTDSNGVPDALMVDEGDGNLTLLDCGKEMESRVIDAAIRLEALLETAELISAEVDNALEAVEKEIRQIRKARRLR
ncbi:MAG: hypothetical protein IJ138_02120 [Clostridia bacterium]|nr:hypothetical protein [Clostridia bacterium]